MTDALLPPHTPGVSATGAIICLNTCILRGTGTVSVPRDPILYTEMGWAAANCGRP